MILKFGTIFIAICENCENAGGSPLCDISFRFFVGFKVAFFSPRLMRFGNAVALGFILGESFIAQCNIGLDFLSWKFYIVN